MIYQADVRARLEHTERLRHVGAEELEAAIRAGGAHKSDKKKPWEWVWDKLVQVEGLGSRVSGPGSWVEGIGSRRFLRASGVYGNRMQGLGLCNRDCLDSKPLCSGEWMLSMCFSYPVVAQIQQLPCYA